MKPLDLHVNFYIEAEEQLKQNTSYQKYWKEKVKEAAEEIDFLAGTIFDETNE